MDEWEIDDWLADCSDVVTAAEADNDNGGDERILKRVRIRPSDMLPFWFKMICVRPCMGHLLRAAGCVDFVSNLPPFFRATAA